MIGLKQVKTWPKQWQDKTLELYNNGLAIDQARKKIAAEMSAAGLLDDQGCYIECKPEKTTKTKPKKQKIRTAPRTKPNEIGRLPTMIIDSAPETVGQDITFDEVKSRITAAMDSYNAKIGYDWDHWRTKGKPQEWRGLCRAVGQTVFKPNKGILKESIRKTNSAMPTNNNAYDVNEKLPLLLDYYCSICEFVGLPCKVSDFALFAGMEAQNFDNWSVPTSRGFNFYKKAMELQASSIAACAEGSRIVSVVGLARLNAFHGWTKTSEVIHNTGGAVTPTASLPHFDAPSLENK